MENYHLVNERGEWKLKKENSKRASKSFGNSSKADAIKKSAELLQKSGGSLKVHKLDGKIQEERTYPRKKDPRKSKG